MDRTFKLSKHKFFEIQLSKFSAINWFYVSLKWDFKGDHCGPKLVVEVYGIYFSMMIYDSRHWFWEADRFYEPGEELRLAQQQKPLDLEVLLKL